MAKKDLDAFMKGMNSRNHNDHINAFTGYVDSKDAEQRLLIEHLVQQEVERRMKNSSHKVKTEIELDEGSMRKAEKKVRRFLDNLFKL